MNVYEFAYRSSTSLIAAVNEAEATAEYAALYGDEDLPEARQLTEAELDVRTVDRIPECLSFIDPPLQQTVRQALQEHAGTEPVQMCASTRRA